MEIQNALVVPGERFSPVEGARACANLNLSLSLWVQERGQDRPLTDSHRHSHSLAPHWLLLSFKGEHSFPF